MAKNFDNFTRKKAKNNQFCLFLAFLSTPSFYYYPLFFEIFQNVDPPVITPTIQHGGGVEY